jgi:hypothetical protein
MANNFKLGKKSAKRDRRTLRFAHYATSLPAPPAEVNWTRGISNYGMMLNDNLGNCTIAACGHAVQTWTADASSEVTLPDWVIQFYYQTWCGYNPTDPSTDQGGVEVDVLNNWRKYGFGLRSNHQGARKLYAYADPDPVNIIHVKQAIALLGGVYIGIELPLTAQSQAVWDSVQTSDGEDAPGSWGGHAVWVVGYNVVGPVCITWGALKQLTWAFWLKYVDEVHALLSYDFIQQSTFSPSGFNLTALAADLQLVTA